MEAEIDDEEPAEGIQLGTVYPWEGSDRDYKYEEVRHSCRRMISTFVLLLSKPPFHSALRSDHLVYELVQLLGRVFNILRENNPELSAERRRTIMRPPQVLREGTKKTVFVNFMDLCKTYAYIYVILLELQLTI